MLGISLKNKTEWNLILEYISVIFNTQRYQSLLWLPFSYNLIEITEKFNLV